MTPAVQSMLARYHCATAEDYENALKEIIQEIALLGLWRAKFFEHAAFYGGTSLRILYGLDRFSEDLDFSLLKSVPNFDLKPYLKAIEAELSSVGFSIRVEQREKIQETAIESAFIKAGTREHLLKIDVPSEVSSRAHRNSNMQIKLEIDTDPPGRFETDVKVIGLPIPFSVNTYSIPDLFAGKVHAVLERKWRGNRVKGRDFYDFAWYVLRDKPIRLAHLHERLKQSGNWSKQNGWSSEKLLSKDTLNQLLFKKIEQIDFEAAKRDVEPFIKDKAALNLWGKTMFEGLARGIQVYQD